MIYDVSHKTTFDYSYKVDMSQHLLHLTPRARQRQKVHRHAIIVSPTPTVTEERSDYFGNGATYLTVEDPHETLTIASTARVEIDDAVRPPAPETTMSWDALRDMLAAAHDTDLDGRLIDVNDRTALDIQQYVFDSPFTGSEQARAYALPSFPSGRPVLAGAVDLMRRIYQDFEYEGGVTDIYTPVDQVLKDRRGVCQDFAHLQIACLRALRLPARYVSGYLMTHPPEGQEKLVGSDASHAWLAVWTPEHGWVDLDPTNDMLPHDEHITLAWGRDYGDVSPVNGIVLGGGDQTVKVAVDVRPVEIAATT